MDSQFEKTAAESSVRYLSGVRGVTKLIVVDAGIDRQIVKDDIVAALKRSAELDAKQVSVEQIPSRSLTTLLHWILAVLNVAVWFRLV